MSALRFHASCAAMGWVCSLTDKLLQTARTRAVNWRHRVTAKRKKPVQSKAAQRSSFSFARACAAETRIDGAASWEARCGTHRAGKLELMRYACGHSSQAAPGRLAHLPPQVLATFEAGSHRLKLTARH
jgi:hypothetical protein